MKWMRVGFIHNCIFSSFYVVLFWLERGVEGRLHPKSARYASTKACLNSPALCGFEWGKNAREVRNEVREVQVSPLVPIIKTRLRLRIIRWAQVGSNGFTYSHVRIVRQGHLIRVVTASAGDNKRLSWLILFDSALKCRRLSRITATCPLLIYYQK
jgi:hypothetical protein